MQQSPCKAKVVCIPCAIIPFSLLPETFSFASPPPLSDNLSVSLASAFLSLFLSRLSVQMSALSYLFARAQSNVLLPLFTSTALPHRHSFFRHCPSPSLNFVFHLLHLPIFSSPTQSFIARTQITPYFPIFFIQLCCVLFIWIPPLCHLNSIFCTILASPMSLPYPSAPTPPPHPLLFMDHGTYIGVTSWHFQCWLRLVHQVFWLKSTAITHSIDSIWIYFEMRVRVCSCLTHRITKHLIPLSIILKCLFLSPFALLLIFLSPHIHLPPVLLYPSLYLSIITAMTHVAHTCSAVEGGLREGVAFHRLTDIKKPAQWRVWKGVTMYFSHTLTIFLICTMAWVGRRGSGDNIAVTPDMILIYRNTCLITVAADKCGCNK